MFMYKRLILSLELSLDIGQTICVIDIEFFTLYIAYAWIKFDYYVCINHFNDWIQLSFHLCIPQEQCLCHYKKKPL